VVVISVDGLRPDAVLAEQPATLMALAASGAATWQAQTVVPAATLPGHASMFSGVPPEVHGVTWNDYVPEQGYIQVPTMLSIAHAAGLRVVLVAGKQKFDHLNPPGSTDVYVFVTNGDQGVADEAIRQAAAGFDLMVVHFPNADYFGHLEGWMSPTYLRQLHRTDDAIGRLLAALPAGTTVIVTADHGGHGLEHGRAPEDLAIPWIVAGPRVAPGTVITEPVSVMDTAATALHVLGLRLPAGAAGRVIAVGP
jgi:predicted AlkP superfamily pyrophosphatase or phosphodiesterase